MNLVIIGYRGNGKRTIARLLAAQLGWLVLSTDARIIEQAGRSIPDIVASDGWDHFRDLESAVCNTLTQQDRLVIDTGGGIILRPANVAALRSNGLVFWLTATVATIAQRIAGDTQRPSLTAGATFVEEIQEVLAERTPTYQAAADYHIATDHLPPEDIASDIVNIVNQDMINRAFEPSPDPS